MGKKAVAGLARWDTGVYLIRNKVNGKGYVGSGAYSIRERWYIHVTELRKQVHCNIYLQRAWNKHGEGNFVLEVLELCEPERCVEREQHWMDKLGTANPKKGYNRNPKAGSMLGFKHSEKSKQLISSKGKGRRHSEDAKARISAKMKIIMLGNKHFQGKVHTEETKEKIAAAARKQWENEEHRKTVSAKVSATLTGRRLSAESLAKRTEKQRAGLVSRNKDPEMRAKISAKLMGHPVSEQTRAKISKAVKDRAKERSFQEAETDV